MAKTYNMPQVGPKDFAKFIEKFIRIGNFSPVLGLGMAGIGKTEIVKEIAKNLGVSYKTLRLVDKTETDLLGIPEAVEMLDPDGNTIRDNDGHNKHVTKYAPTSLLPDAERDGEVGILVIDEITSALPNVQSVLYQLLDADRSMGNYTLPPKWKVIMIGNGEDDGGTYQGITPALINRCHACFRIEPDYESWISWAVNHNVHDVVLAYIKSHNNNLHVMDTEDVGVFPSPRSWTLFSNTLKGFEELSKADGEELSEFVVDQLASSAVGASVGVEFATFYMYKNSMLNPEDILAGKVSASAIKNLSSEAAYITLQSVTSSLRTVLEKYTFDNIPKEALDKVSNVVRWACDVASIKADYALSMIQDLTQIELFSSLLIYDKVTGCVDQFINLVNEYGVVFG